MEEIARVAQIWHTNALQANVETAGGVPAISALRTSGKAKKSLWNHAARWTVSLLPYRGKMTSDQLSMLEKQYMERDLLEKAGLPRLSLFYMHDGCHYADQFWLPVELRQIEIEPLERGAHDPAVAPRQFARRQASVRTAWWIVSGCATIQTLLVLRGVS